MSNKEVRGMVAERWNNLDQDMRKVYQKKAGELKNEYLRELEEIKAKKCD